MKPLFHPRLVNTPNGDPGVLVEFLFERRALLFDLGDNTPLSPRTLLSVTHAFVSHTHMDHFIGFDRLARLLVGRDKQLHLFGPPGLIDQVGHKLAAYTWNLVANYTADFAVTVTELAHDGAARHAHYHSRDAFRRTHETESAIPDRRLVDEPQFSVRHALLDHRIPSVAYALEEKQHINVWKNRLDEMGLTTGPWLRDLKRAILAGEADSTLVRAGAEGGERLLSLGELKRNLVHIEPGQKVAYVTDAAGHEANAQRILELISDADILFIETPFLQEDGAMANGKYHLTAARAGELARRAGVGRIVPFHYSARYPNGEVLAREAQAAFEQRDR
ncbi:ribonuclease Z [Thiohalomonas denitrificans]|uniref:Ribonuclease Z n=1 Tax=Thiohalomonas denitrificans TaxID=415747 RepID=A0A1G5Q5X7_9GAMM|nr:MBL fold metallo-hydrolase [Thiohalomonas denitrificans]SCZ57253.1 ribonuclease Z [Thiohalomonas denitrificans]